MLSNSKRPSSIISKLLWGAGFGELIFNTQVIAFFISCIGSNFTKQFNKITFISSSFISNMILRVSITYAIYSFLCAIFFSILNVVYQVYYNNLKPIDALSDGNFRALKSPDDINQLFELAVNRGLLKLTKPQKGLAIFAFILFSFMNALSCLTFKDVNDDARVLLPDYAGMYTPLNRYAGTIGYIAVFLFNQWFAFYILRRLLYKYNILFKITRPYFHKIRNASLSKILFNIIMTLFLSTLSSLGFFYLAKDDPSLINYPTLIQYGIITAPLLIYGLVLNLLGSQGIIHHATSFWDWIRTFPKLKTYQQTYFSNELKHCIDKRIRKLDNEVPLTTQTLRRLIIEEHKKLITTKIPNSNQFKIWKQSLFRKIFSTIISMLGPLGFTISLYAYYLLVEQALSKLVHVEANDAIPRMLSFYLFYIYGYLMHNTGYKAVNKLFNNAENCIKNIINTIQIGKGKIKEKEVNYTDRFLPIHRKEYGMFAFDTVFFGSQFIVFFITPPSSGCILMLLNQINCFNPFTQHTVFWFTALCNSFGVSSFLNYIKPKISDKLFHKNKREMLGWNAGFFAAIEGLPDSQFKIKELTHKFHNTHKPVILTT